MPSQNENDLASDDGLETSILLSLFLDRRAEPGDVLPGGETERRGWWADAFPIVEGDLIGSRLWLVARAKDEQSFVDRLQAYAKEALQWLIDDLVAESVDVVAQVPSPGAWALSITVTRPDVDPVTFNYNDVWVAQAED